MKALGFVVSDKKIFENCILKTYFLTPWPTYATNWNDLNNFDRGPPRNHSCEVWSKSNKRFQRCSLKKLLTDARTHGRRTPDIEGSQKLTEHFVLRWAKNAWRNWRTRKKARSRDNNKLQKPASAHWHNKWRYQTWQIGQYKNLHTKHIEHHYATDI